MDMKATMPMMSGSSRLRLALMKYWPRPGNANTHGHTIRDDRYKLIRFLNDSEEFYDLQVDPTERSDLLAGALAADEQARYENLASIMSDLLSSEE